MKWLKNYFRREREKMEGYSSRQKAEYIWQYYKLWIIGISSVLILAIYLIIRINTVLSDHWCYMAFVNTTQKVGTKSELWDGYVDYTGYDLSEKLVEFNNELYFDYTNNYAKGNDYYEVFIAYTDSGVLDGVTMDVEALTLFGQNGRLLDLNSDACASIKEKYGDKFIYTTPYDTEYSTDEVPIGIDVSDSILMTKYHIYSENCALGISAYSQNVEAVEKFLDYIYQGTDNGEDVAAGETEIESAANEAGGN